MKKVFISILAILLATSCYHKSEEQNLFSDDLLFTTDDIPIGTISEDGIQIPKINNLFGEELIWKGETITVTNQYIIGEKEAFRYLVIEGVFKMSQERISNGELTPDIKIATRLFTQKEKLNKNMMTSGGDTHSCSGDSDNILLRCSCCSFKKNESGEITGCNCCQFGHFAHTVTSGGGDESFPPVRTLNDMPKSVSLKSLIESNLRI